MSASEIHELHRYLTVCEAAEYLRVSKSFLDKLRVTGGGPIFIKSGSRVLYSIERLDEWMTAREFASTSEIPAELAA